MSTGDSETLGGIGEDALRDRLRQTSGDRIFVTHGPSRENALRWLGWRKDVANYWSNVGTVAAVIAAVTGIIDLLK